MPVGVAVLHASSDPGSLRSFACGESAVAGEAR